MAESIPLPVRVKSEDKEKDADPSVQSVAAAEKSSSDQAVQTSIVGTNDDEELSETSDSDADSDTAESKRVQQLWETLQEAEARLYALPVGHEDIPRNMNAIANHINDYHAIAETEDEGAFIHALEVAASAEGLAPQDSYWRGATMDTQMWISFTMYRTFKKVDWLHCGIDFGKESVQFARERAELFNPVAHRMSLAKRCERLAEGYRMLYEEEGGWMNIQDAVYCQGLAVDNTRPADYQLVDGDDDGDGEGLRERYWRFNCWCSLYVRLMDEQPDRELDAVIRHAAERYPCDFDSELRVAKASFFNVFGLECRQWAITRKSEHLQLVLDRIRKVVQADVQSARKKEESGENPDAHKFTLDRYARDPDNPRHLLRRAAKLFNWYYGVNERNSPWRKHVATINTVIALWEELRRQLKCETLADLREDMAAIVCLQEFYAQRYHTTKIAAHGWQHDDLNYENRRKSMVIISIYGIKDCDVVEVLDEDNKCIEDLVADGARSSTVGSSIVTKQDFVCVDSVEAGWDFMAQRLKFKCDLGADLELPSVDTWISGRTDDGQWILGGAMEGRDDDVLAYIKGYGKCESEAQGLPRAYSGWMVR